MGLEIKEQTPLEKEITSTIENLKKAKEFKVLRNPIPSELITKLKENIQTLKRTFKFKNLESTLFKVTTLNSRTIRDVNLIIAKFEAIEANIEKVIETVDDRTTI